MKKLFILFTLLLSASVHAQNAQTEIEKNDGLQCMKPVIISTKEGPAQLIGRSSSNGSRNDLSTFIGGEFYITSVTTIGKPRTNIPRLETLVKIVDVVRTNKKDATKVAVTINVPAANGTLKAVRLQCEVIQVYSVIGDEL